MGSDFLGIEDDDNSIRGDRHGDNDGHGDAADGNADNTQLTRKYIQLLFSLC